MTCKSKECENYKEYYKWEQFDINIVSNPFNFCDTDLMPSMPDDCSRCKRAYRDLFRKKVT